MTTLKVSDRPLAYYNIDGVGELGMGFMFLCFGLLTWLQDHTPKDAVWHQMYGYVIYFGAMLAIIHYGGKAIKEHITYPRTGFVEYRKRDRWRPGIMAAVVPPLFLIALIVAHRHHWHIITGISIYGLILAAGLARGVVIWGVRWKWVVVLLGAAGSLALPALPADVVGALADHTPVPGMIPAKLVGAWVFLLLLWGTLLSVSGSISLWLYLRRTEAPAREAA